jgi:16S rRNA (guanine966-N2)-methyltransferase
MNLFMPKSEVRPTMDLVKGAIFSSLGERIAGARVLDLFSGSGALGIEALSRGCASAVLVEKNSNAIETIRRNLAKAKLEAKICQLDVFNYLSRVALPGEFDLIFADPPYAKAPTDRDFGRELLASPALAKALAPEGLFILEQLPGTGGHEESGDWECLRIKRYGATEVAVLQRRTSEALAEPPQGDV